MKFSRIFPRRRDSTQKLMETSIRLAWLWRHTRILRGALKGGLEKDECFGRKSSHILRHKSSMHLEFEIFLDSGSR